MSYAYDVSAWHDFAVGLTSASAALTGLVFVAMSIHLREVLAGPIDRRRAGGAFFSLLAILGFAVVALFPGITRQTYGSCAVAVALVQLVRSARGALLFRIGDPESEAWVTLVGAALSYVAMLWGGIGLLTRSGGGMYVLAAALVVNGALVVRVVWSVFVSISEEEAMGEVAREDA